MTGADMRRAVMTGADMRRADMTRADMTGAVMTGADMAGAVMTGADMRRAFMTDAVMRRAVMTSAVMTGAVMAGADMAGAVMTGDKIDGFYEYDALWFYSDDKYHIHFGCKRLLATDWVSNFWNNDNEFPNNGSEKTMKRVILFKEIVRRIELDANTNNRVTDELRALFSYDLKELIHEP
jgi:hypothetical protein